MDKVPVAVECPDCGNENTTAWTEPAVFTVIARWAGIEVDGPDQPLEEDKAVALYCGECNWNKLAEIEEQKFLEAVRQARE